ncbi:MAG: diguanylate cyclase [Candidatus Thiodiazotropha sp. (ex Codakia rugifera)]|nr:diguanylate cyclase [Candidatus Thiodiazotropha sp. (ex Codakia rugifera)]
MLNHSHAHAKSRSAGSIRKGAELLIVDECSENIQILRDVLKQDYYISSASTTEEILDMINQGQKPDLVLLDLFMQSGEGFRICSLLKDNLKTSNIPVIIMAARNDPDDQIQGLSLGADDFIIKPFHIPLLKARINNHLNLKSKADLLEHLAHIDGLTHIPNRRRFDTVLKQEWRRAIRAGTSLAILMADLDDFKEYNDLHGHGNGDDYLRVVADCLSNELQRPGDLVARYGGEEFVVLLPDCGLKNAVTIAERMRIAVESLPVEHLISSDSKPATVSVGCAAERPDLTRHATQLIERADQNLYKAKSLGKNRVWGRLEDEDTNKYE